MSFLFGITQFFKKFYATHILCHDHACIYDIKSLSDYLEKNWSYRADIWASTWENLSTGFANKEGADQPAHLRRLINTIVIRFSESMISKLATQENSVF